MGYVDLDPNNDDAWIDGEAVVNQRDIIMLEKLNEDATLTMRKSLHLRQTTKKICGIVMMRPVDKYITIVMIHMGSRKCKFF